LPLEIFTKNLVADFFNALRHYAYLLNVPVARFPRSNIKFYGSKDLFTSY